MALATVEREAFLDGDQGIRGFSGPLPFFMSLGLAFPKECLKRFPLAVFLSPRPQETDYIDRDEGNETEEGGFEIEPETMSD